MKRMKIRRLIKNLLEEKTKEMYYLITGLGTILADFQEGLAKTNPYAHKLVLSHKVKKD